MKRVRVRCVCSACVVCVCQHAPPAAVDATQPDLALRMGGEREGGKVCARGMCVQRVCVVCVCAACVQTVAMVLVNGSCGEQA